MVLLTKRQVAKIERVCVLQSAWNILKFLYVACMIFVYAYASYKNSYEFFYHRIVSFMLTANVVWVVCDIFYSPLKEIMSIINARRK